MSASQTKEDDTLKQVHLWTFSKALQVEMLGGLKHVIFSLSIKNLEILGSTVLDHLHKGITNPLFHKHGYFYKIIPFCIQKSFKDLYFHLFLHLSTILSQWNLLDNS